VTVPITGALSGAVLLTSISNQLGSVGYTILVEYIFYVFFALTLLCIVSVLITERLRSTEAPRNERLVKWIEYGTRTLFLIVVVATVAYFAVSLG
jgi:hypothetical protein